MFSCKNITLLIFLISGISGLRSQADSISIFYERYNTVLTVSLADFRNEMKTSLGDKAATFTACMDALAGRETGKILYVREGFWNAPGCAGADILFQVEYIPLGLFKSGMAKLSRNGKTFTNDMVTVEEGEFKCCGKKGAPACGTAWFVKSKTEGILMRAIKSFNENAAAMKDCNAGFE